MTNNNNTRWFLLDMHGNTTAYRSATGARRAVDAMAREGISVLTLTRVTRGVATIDTVFNAI